MAPVLHGSHSVLHINQSECLRQQLHLNLIGQDITSLLVNERIKENVFHKQKDFEVNKNETFDKLSNTLDVTDYYDLENLKNSNNIYYENCATTFQKDE